MSLEPGQVLNDRYRIVRIIKSGGMGSVYEAIDTKLADSPCAVKEIHEAAQASRDSDYIQGRFYEEMKALVALDHASIPKVRDYLTQGSTIYIVMELVQGRSLDEEIQERVARGSPPPVDHIVLDIIRLLETLAYLHGQNPPVIHRDIKPANILRDQRSGQIKLVDFGLARSLQGTHTQTVVGTMGYCAPEQLMGKSEQRSDIYSAGITLVHLLTGCAPEMELFEARRPELPGVRPGLTEIIAKATEPKPQDRYVNAHQMIDALQGWLYRPSGQLGGATQSMPVAASQPGSPAGGQTGPAQPVPVSGAVAGSASELKAPITMPPWAGKAAAVAVVLGSLGLGVLAGQSHKPVSSTKALVPTSTPIPVGKASARVAALIDAEERMVAAYQPPPPPPVYQPPAYSPSNSQRPVYSPPRRQVDTSAPRPVSRQPVVDPFRVEVSQPSQPQVQVTWGHSSSQNKGRGRGRERRQREARPSYSAPSYNPPPPAPAPQVQVNVPVAPLGRDIPVKITFP